MMIRLYAYLKVDARKGIRQGNLPNRLHKRQSHSVRLARGVQFNLLSSYKSPPPGYDPEQSGLLKRGFSSVGRASALQAECQRFESVNLHHLRLDVSGSTSKWKTRPGCNATGL